MHAKAGAGIFSLKKMIIGTQKAKPNTSDFIATKKSSLKLNVF